jgi:sugar phosphate isomerase/epimerase
MKLGISNLAWNDEIDFKILKNNNINYIEIILPKFINWESNDLFKLESFIDLVKSNNIDIKSTQSLFYNTGINSYYSGDFISHLTNVSNICYKENITHLVLGAPTMRIENSLGLSKTFLYIDGILKEKNQVLLLEPNSRIYNGNYFFTVKEIINFIQTNRFTNIKTMIDTHNIILEGENPFEIFINYSSYIDHVHVSENNLGDFTESEQHYSLASKLKEYNYSGLIVYESKPSLNLLESIKLFNKIYNT